MRPSVYLAGPIRGLDYGSAVDWRDVAKGYLAQLGIDAYSPMRGKEHLRSVQSLDDDHDEHPLSSARGILARDRWDCSRHDAVLVNLVGAERVSIGTTMEIAWADAKRIPVICAVEPEGNVHEHSMLMGCVDFRVPTIAEATRLTAAILLP